MARLQPLRLPPPRLNPTTRVLVAVVLPAAATAALPLAAIAPFWSVSIVTLGLVALTGVYAWLTARATVEHRVAEIAFVTALATALLAPGGGSLLVPTALAIWRYRVPAPPRAANDNQPGPEDGWVPVTAERAKLLLDQSAA